MFDIKTDLQVLIRVPNQTELFFNIDNWDEANWGDDADDGFEYVNFAHRCSEFQTSNGVTAIGTTIDLGAKEGTVILVAQDEDPLDGRKVIIGTQLWLQVDVPVFGEIVWFKATVKGLQRDADSNGLNRVVLTLGDQIEQLTSSEVTISVLSDQTFYARWQSILNSVLGDVPISLIYAVPTYAQFTFPGIDIFETALLDTVNETMAGELGWLVTNNQGEIFPYAHGALLQELGIPQWEIHQDVTDHHIPPTYVNQGSDSQSIINTLNTSLTWDPGTVVSVVDTDSRDIVGAKTADVEVNLADEANLIAFANYALTLSDQQNIRSITFDCFDHRTQKLYDLWQFQPATCVRVNLQAGQINVDENYLVSKIHHQITPDTWQTDLELWRQ
jgi:hypothetical protein